MHFTPALTSLFLLTVERRRPTILQKHLTSFAPLRDNPDDPGVRSHRSAEEETVQCQQCQHENNAAGKFCEEYGSKLARAKGPARGEGIASGTELTRSIPIAVFFSVYGNAPATLPSAPPSGFPRSRE